MSALVDSSHDRDRLRAGWTSLVIGTCVFAGKFAAWQWTESTAVFSDAMESTINIVAAGLMLLALVIAARPADRDHPYGHGKVEFFSAGIEGTFIFLAGVLVVARGLHDLWLGSSPHDLDVGLSLLGVTSGVNAALGLYLIRTGRRTRSLALEADGRHVLADVWTSAAVIVGLCAVWATGWMVLDPLIALAAGANILREGWSVARRAVSGLMDEADPDALRRIVDTLEHARGDAWIDLHDLRSWRSGAVAHVDCHMTVPRYFDVSQVHGIHDDVKVRLAVLEDAPEDVVIHFDPCTPRDCRRCAMSDCAVRSHDLEARPAFSAELEIG